MRKQHVLHRISTSCVIFLRRIASCCCCSGAWRTKNFKAYNFNALGQRIDCGHLHPLLKVRTQFRQILLEMGRVFRCRSSRVRCELRIIKHCALVYCSFCEMPSNRFVESSFWNFDALFQPQQHPARDAHDTFFVSRESSPPACRTCAVSSLLSSSWRFFYFRTRNFGQLSARIHGASEEGAFRRRLRIAGVSQRCTCHPPQVMIIQIMTMLRLRSLMNSFEYL